LAPFIYFGIITAFMFGWIFFNEFPIDTLFPGVLLIVGAGVLIVWRENQVNKS
jgi:drug/metabolite transporter (DMT)-like permease